jgi:hypothetical protein
VSLEGARAPSQETTEYHKDQPLPIRPFVFSPMPISVSDACQRNNIDTNTNPVPVTVTGRMTLVLRLSSFVSQASIRLIPHLWYIRPFQNPKTIFGCDSLNNSIG